MNKEKWVRIFSSRDFKRIVFIFGIVFLFLTALISVKPEPFLKFGYIGVFVFNLFGPGTLLIPSLSKYMNIFLLAFASSAGMSLNDSLSWYIGKFGHEIIPHSKKAEKIEKGVRKHGFPALFLWSLIPIPYDIIGLIAGYIGFSYKRFIIPTFLGKFTRFILLGLGVLKVLG